MKIQYRHIFDTVMIWTIITTIFAWLPLARIMGRPEGYHWGIMGFSGEGTEGPFWIFIVLTLYVVTLLYSAHRSPRKYFYPLLVLWHLAVTAIVAAGTIAEGSAATIQGQGLHWEFPLWIFIIPCAVFLTAAVIWSVRDFKAGSVWDRPEWTKKNTLKLTLSLLLAAAAIVLFQLGTNYNWVTALAIIVTICQWIILAESFKPVTAQSNQIPVTS